MNAQNTHPGADPGASHSSRDGQSVTIGVGGPTSGEEGATPSHETMQETGGSGGRALTQPRTEEETEEDGRAAPLARRQAQAPGGQAQDAAEPEATGSAATAVARGYQDTRSRQASPGSTGLGTPETGGNQDQDDLAPPRGE